MSDKEQYVHMADHLQGCHGQADFLNVDLMCAWVLGMSILHKKICKKHTQYKCAKIG